MSNEVDEASLQRKATTKANAFALRLYSVAALGIFGVPAALIVVLLHVAATTASAGLHAGVIVAAVALGLFVLLMSVAFSRTVNAMGPEKERLVQDIFDALSAEARTRAESKTSGKDAS